MNIEIFKELKQSQKECIQRMQYTNKEKEFLEKFILSNQLNTILNIIKINLCDMMIAFLTVEKNHLTFEEIKAKVKSNQTLINDMNSQDFLFITGSILEIVDMHKEQELKEILTEKNKAKQKWLINKFLASATVPEEVMSKLSYYLHQEKKINLLDLLDLVCDNTKRIKDCFVGIFLIKRIQKEEKTFQTKIDTVKEEDHISIRISPKEIERLFLKIIKTEYNLDILYKQLEEIKTYTSSLIAQEKKEKQKTKKELAYYIDIEEWLQKQNTQKRITTLPSNLMKIPKQQLRMQILKMVYQQNRIFDKQLSQEYENLSQNSKNHFRLLLQEYGINIDEYQVDMQKGIDDTKRILEILKTFSISKKEEIIEILNHTTKDIAEYLLDIVNKGYITKNFINENKYLFIENESTYHHITENIALIQQKNISPMVVIKTPEILLEDPEKIKRNLEILEDYQFLNTLKNSTSLTCLNYASLDEKIDEALELGLETYLEKDLAHLGSILEAKKRIILLKQLHIPLETETEISAVLHTKKFILTEDKLDDYIYDATLLNTDIEEGNRISTEEFLQYLKTFPKTKRTYQIGGVVISKNKVMRNLGNYPQNVSEKERLQLLLSNKIISQEELETIQQFLQGFSTYQK